MSTTEQVQSTGKYSAKWQERFDFFETYGAPNDPRYKEAVNALPGFKKKILINANVIAFFFGPIYLFVLGLWKKKPGPAGYFRGDPHRIERDFRNHRHGVSPSVEHGPKHRHVDDVRTHGQLRLLPQGSERRARLEPVQRHASLIAGLGHQEPAPRHECAGLLFVSRGNLRLQRPGVRNNDPHIRHSPIAPDLYQGTVTWRHATYDGRDLGRTVHRRTGDLQNDVPAKSPIFAVSAPASGPNTSTPFSEGKPKLFTTAGVTTPRCAPRCPAATGTGAAMLLAGIGAGAAGAVGTGLVATLGSVALLREQSR